MGQIRKTMLYNTETRKWEWWTVGRPLRSPWRVAWIRTMAFLRYARRRSALFPRIGEERVYDLDPDTLTMRDPKRERRMRRRERHAKRFAKIADAVIAMVEMQKHIG